MLTPLEIENKRFKKEVFGYAQLEVEDFLAEISQNYERMYKDNVVAKDRIEMLTDAIKQYKSMEETLQNALLVARTTGEEICGDAQSKAEQIIADAKVEAKMIINDANTEVKAAKRKFQELIKNVEIFRAKSVELLNAQLSTIKKHSADAEVLDISLEKDFPDDGDFTPKSVAAATNEDPFKTAVVDIKKVLADVGKISDKLEEKIGGSDENITLYGSEPEEE